MTQKILLPGDPGFDTPEDITILDPGEVPVSMLKDLGIQTRETFQTKDKKYKIIYNMPSYNDYVHPQGWLNPHRACRALWHYYVSARNTYEKFEKDIIAYEGSPDPVVPNYTQLMSSLARAYGAKPEDMVKFWENVDRQCVILGLPLMPNTDKHRQNRVPMVVMQ